MQRPSRMRILLAVLLAATAVVATAPASDASGDEPPPSATVVVDGHAFTPAQVRVARGGTVTFDFRESPHTAAANDGSFAVRGPNGGAVPAGTSRDVVMPDEDVLISYHCEIHPGMSGRIVVGTPSLGGDGSIIRVPEDASLADAVLLAAPGDTVDLAPGRHVLSAPLDIGGEDLTIRGRTGNAADVTVSAGEKLLPTAVELSGRHLRLHGLTVVAGRDSGIRAGETAQGLQIRNVSVTTGPVSAIGIDAAGVAGLRLDDVRLDGFRGDAVRVRDCPACGLWISDLHVTGSRTGIRLVDVGGALVQSSTIDAPVDGVVLSGVAGLHLTANTVTEAARYGIALAGGVAVDNVVASNDVATSAGPDLAWDGAGTRTCFHENQASDTSPPTLTATASCDRTNPWSLPWPLPLIDHTGAPT